MRRLGRVLLVGVCLAALFEVQAAPERKVLSGHLSHLPKPGPLAQRLESTNTLSLTLGLPLRHPQALSALLCDLYNPASPQFHHFLKPHEFAAQFGPTEADYQKVIGFARDHGFQVTGTHPGRMVLEVSATVGAAEKAFQVHLVSSPHPTEKRAYFAPDTEPSVTTDLPLLDVCGLDNFSAPRPLASGLVPLDVLQNEPEDWSGSGLHGTFVPADFRAAYAPGASADGTGQSVGLLEFDTCYASDIRAYETLEHLPEVVLRHVRLPGASGSPGKGNVEVALDVEMALGMAPGLSSIVLYEAPYDEGYVSHYNSLLIRMAEDDAAAQLSSSWAPPSGPSLTRDQIFQQMAVQGQSFLQASGDEGAYATGVHQRADNPYTTIVGGTSLNLWFGGYSYETVWNLGGSNNVSGGGITGQYPIPAWQQGLDMSANGGSTQWRNSPDVAMLADGVYIRCNNGKQGAIGGTSVAAPLWAAFTALINQEASAHGLPRVGFLNPALYTLCQGNRYATCFHDVTSGNNATAASPDRFYAGPGYDLSTGWGSPAGQALITQLTTGRAAVALNPTSTPTATGLVGGPFANNQASLTLANIGWLPLSWAIGNVPEWLDVSATGGALNPDERVTLNLALNALAANLGPGTYSAQLIVTNLTDGTEQSFLFPLHTWELAALQVILSPAAAIPAGARWRVDGGPWQNSGDVVLDLASDDHLLEFAVAPNWTSARSQTIRLLGNRTNTWTIAYGQQFGSLTMVLRPRDAVVGGAHWQVDGGPWLNSGDTATNLPAGYHEVHFSSIAGWVTPSNQTLLVNGNEAATGEGVYSEVYAFTTIAGQSGTNGWTDGTNSTALFSSPNGIAVDTHGTVFVVDTGNEVIRQLTPQGTNWVVTTIAGSPGSPGATDGTNATAQFKHPYGIAVDTSGHIYVADAGNGSIRQLSPAGTNWAVQTLLSSGGFPSYTGITVETNGRLWVTDVYPTDGASGFNTLNLLSQSDSGSWSLQGFMKYPFPVYFGSPYGVVVVPNTGPLVVNARGNNLKALASYWSSGYGPIYTTATIVGSLSEWAGFADGTATAAQFAAPQGIALDAAGNVYVADTGNHTIRKLLPLSGGGNQGFPLYCAMTCGGRALCPGNADGLGAAARFCSPSSLAVDANGNLYVADTGNHTIRKGASVLRSVQVFATRNNHSFPAAQFQVDGGAWTATSSTVRLALGLHQVTFSTVPGWLAPSPAIVTVTDTTNTFSFTYGLAESARPSLAIMAPAPGRPWTNETVVLSGLASGNLGVAAVYYQFQGGPWTAATGTNFWESAPTSLPLGTITARAYAVDVLGNCSKTNMVRFVHAPMAPITITCDGPGTISPILTGQFLALGRKYTLTAKPAPGSIFVNWGGDRSVATPALTFLMQTNLTLQANFMPNPFPAVVGNYQGLFYDTNQVLLPSSGSFSARLTSSGAFSATLCIQGERHNFSGHFSPAGTASNYVARPANPIALRLQLNLADGTGLTGELSTPMWNAHLTAYRSAFSKSLPSPNQGRYTLRFPTGVSNVLQPGGDGYGAATVDALGNIRFTGALGDGTVLSQAAMVSVNGQWPFYASLYQGAGAVFGWLTFSNAATSELQGSVTWMKMPQVDAAFYPDGFTLQGEAQGSTYRFTKNQPVLRFASGSLVLTGGNLSVALTNAVALDSQNRLTDLNANGLSLTIATGSGLLHGSLTNPVTLQRSPFSGAILQNQNAGYGVFLGTNATGAVFLGLTP